MSLMETEKKYWVNGYIPFAGGRYKTFSLSFKNYAIMFCLGGLNCFKFNVYLYKLI